MLPENDGHKWLAIEDEENDTTWMFDLTFMLSNYNCIYGEGCKSIHEQEDKTNTLGCCVHGAHLIDDDDFESVADYADRLTADEWQFKSKAETRGGPFKQEDGNWVTRRTDGACIFLNRPDFKEGSGCALHLAALKRDERPLDWKPDVCWQVPMQLEIHEDDYGYETVLVRAWKRRDWGDGGVEFNWWCIEDPVAYTAKDPVYLTLKDELCEMVGEDIYDRLHAQIQAMPASVGTPVKLSATKPASV